MSFEIVIRGHATGQFGEKVKEIANTALNECLALDGAQDVTLTGYVSDDVQYSHFNSGGAGEPVVAETEASSPTSTTTEPQPPSTEPSTEPLPAPNEAVADPQTTE